MSRSTVPLLMLTAAPNPWAGKWTSQCKQARVEAFRTFLETMAASDVSLPRAPTSRGRFCFGGMPSDGLPPSVDDNGVIRESRCADVWSNSVGAIVVFDLGDGDLQPPEVIWALRDPDITNTGGRISSVSDATHARTFQMSGNTRIGPNPRIYGWLNVPNVIPTTGDSLYGQRQGFWKR